MGIERKSLGNIFSPLAKQVLVSLPTSYGIYQLNEKAQEIRIKENRNPYESYISPEMAEMAINHVSSGVGPLFFTIAYACAYGDIRKNAGRMSLGSIAIFSSYEALDANYKSKSIDVGDVSSILLASALYYGIFSQRMPWNKSNNKLAREHAPAP